MSKFKEGVIKVVKFIPRGQVMSYGQVALYVGTPRAARQVGWILRGLDKDTPVPWWRVVNNEGRISIKNSKFHALEQKELLQKEGLKVANDLTFTIEKYRFAPDENFIRKLELDPIYLGMISFKIPLTKPHFRKK